MSLFKNAPEVDPVWFLVEREHGRATPYQRGTREAALDDFSSYLRSCARDGEAFTPYTRARRLAVTGPAWVIQPDDHADPLLIGADALRAVLSPAEYAAYVVAPVAAALLES